MEETRERKGDGGTEEGHSVGAAADWHGLIGEKWMGGVRKARRRGGREGGRGEAERKLGACHVSNSSYWTWLSTPRLNLEPPPHPAVAALNAVQQSHQPHQPTPPPPPPHLCFYLIWHDGLFTCSVCLSMFFTSPPLPAPRPTTTSLQFSSNCLLSQR